MKMMVAQEFQELLQFIVGINNHLVKIRKHIERENPENKSELTKCVGNTRNNLVILADYVDNLNHDHNRLISFLVGSINFVGISNIKGVYRAICWGYKHFNKSLNFVFF